MKLLRKIGVFIAIQLAIVTIAMLGMIFFDNVFNIKTCSYLHKSSDSSYSCYFNIINKLCVDKNIQDKDGQSPLMRTFNTRYLDIDTLKMYKTRTFLSRNDIDVNITDRKGHTALSLITLEYLHYSYNLNKKYKQLYLQIIHQLLEKGATPNVEYKEIYEDYDQILFHEVLYNTELANLFINYKVDLNSLDEYNGTPLLHATKTRKPDIKLINRMIDMGARLSENSRVIALHKNFQNLKIPKALLAIGANINQIEENSGETPLQYALYKNNIKYAEFLINNGADIYKKNDQGKNAFHYTKSDEAKKLLRR